MGPKLCQKWFTTTGPINYMSPNIADMYMQSEEKESLQREMINATKANNYS